MLTDGALRMLVLLHFDILGFSPIEIAWLFLGYEVAGIVTNLSAGWLAVRFGLTSTLYAGLVHHTDGVEGSRRRLERLRKHYAGVVGVATECGMGRRPPDQSFGELLRIHREVVDAI